MKNIEKYITKHVHDNDFLALLTNILTKKVFGFNLLKQISMYLKAQI